MVYETLRNFKRNHYFSKGQLLPPVIKGMDFSNSLDYNFDFDSKEGGEMDLLPKSNIPVKLVVCFNFSHIFSS